MPSKDKRIDSYIERSADFAKPILTHIRKVVHKACPDVEETWKWSFPNFDYMGSTICSMAAFKQHCAFGFWKASIMEDPDNILVDKTAMGQLGKIKNIQDLPSDKILTKYIKQAAKLNKDGIKLPARKTATDKKEIVIPDDFKKSLIKDKKAEKVFNDFSYSHKKEYLEWITEARTEATREKRIETTLEWLREGKSRHWKYKNC